MRPCCALAAFSICDLEPASVSMLRNKRKRAVTSLLRFFFNHLEISFIPSTGYLTTSQRVIARIISTSALRCCCFWKLLICRIHIHAVATLHSASGNDRSKQAGGVNSLRYFTSALFLLAKRFMKTKCSDGEEKKEKKVLFPFNSAYDDVTWTQQM